MPQLDLVSYCVQVIYVTQAYMLFHLLCQYFILARIGAVLKARKKLKARTERLLKGKDIDMAKALYSVVLKYSL